ncbi:hypothetical protein OG21DRAFT_1491278 [Imleria badia]|nr:hypothetical protein OG21DRAFT_1491278 [Imleria badia]
MTHPSTLKTITVQSPFGWTALMLPYISQYFQPVIPLLQKIQDQLIMPIQLQGKTVSMNEQFTHDDFIDSIVIVLFRLRKPYWKPKGMTKYTNPIPGGISTSSTNSVTISTVLPNGPLARLLEIILPFQ